MRYTRSFVREGDPDRTDDRALRARVRGLVAQGRVADALDAVLDRLAALERHEDTPACDAPDPWLRAPATDAIEGTARTRSSLARLPRVTLEGGELARCARCGADEGAPVPCERLELSGGALRVEVSRAFACDRCGTAPRSGLHPGPALLAHVAVAAHGDGVPYPSQARALRRFAAIAAPVLASWTAAVADALSPIAAELAGRVSSSSVVVEGRADATAVLVGDGLWCAVSSAGHDALLARCEGWVVRDDVRAASGPRDAASWEPLRRALVELARRGDPRVGELLGRVQRLNQIERIATDEGLRPEDRRRRREQRSLPVLEPLRQACLALRSEVAQDAPVGAAIDDALARWAALSRFVHDGRIPLDGGIVDRVVGAVATLRAGGDRSDRRADTLASVLGTCELAAVAPVDQLASALERLELGVRASDVAELLPR